MIFDSVVSAEVAGTAAGALPSLPQPGLLTELACLFFSRFGRDFRVLAVLAASEAFSSDFEALGAGSEAFASGCEPLTPDILKADITANCC